MSAFRLAKSPGHAEPKKGSRCWSPTAFYVDVLSAKFLALNLGKLSIDRYDYRDERVQSTVYLLAISRVWEESRPRRRQFGFIHA